MRVIGSSVVWLKIWPMEVWELKDKTMLMLKAASEAAAVQMISTENKFGRRKKYDIAFSPRRGEAWHGRRRSMAWS